MDIPVPIINFIFRRIINGIINGGTSDQTNAVYSLIFCAGKKLCQSESWLPLDERGLLQDLESWK